MRTLISRPFHWGFVLSEDALRRIVHLCAEHNAKKNTQVQRTQLTAHLKDGTHVETQNIDEILNLQNSGSKQVERLDLLFDDGRDESDWWISLCVQDGKENPKSWTSLDLTVVGQEREWATVAANDIEERFRKARSLPIPYIVNHRFFFLMPFILGALIATYFTTKLAPEGDAISVVEQQYESGKLSDPIKAMILFEREKLKRRTIEQPLIVAVSFLAPAGVALLVFLVVPRIWPSYNFYWGEYKPVYDKRKSALNIFWTVIVLGIIVAVAAGIILHKIGIG